MRASVTRIFEPCPKHLPQVEAGHGYPIDCAACWTNAPAAARLHPAERTPLLNTETT